MFWGVFILNVFHSTNNGYAQITGLTLRSPPMTHALLDEGDILVGLGLSYSKVENHVYQVENIRSESITTTEQMGFLAIAFTDRIAIAASINPTEVRIQGTSVDTSQSVDTTIKSSRNFYFIIPTFVKWEKSRIALIWGKGEAVYVENSTLGIEQSTQEIGTTGLVAEIFLMDSFSIIPWASWPYLLIDLPSFETEDIQTPDYGIEGVIHYGDIKISLTMIVQALKTSEEASGQEEDERIESSSNDEASQGGYAISLSYTF